MTDLIFGYGSLMSARGLNRTDRSMRILNAFPAKVLEAERGFAKPSRAGRLAMDLDRYGYLRGERLDLGERPEQGSVEGLCCEINRRDFGAACRREGCEEIGRRLVGRSPDSIAEYLSVMYTNAREESGNWVETVRRYRSDLRKDLGHTSAHYIPHPLEFRNGEKAIVFIAPASGTGTGDESLISVKEKKHVKGLMNAKESAEENGRHLESSDSMEEYLLECLLGGVHGLYIGDIVLGMSDEQKFQISAKISTILMEREQHYLDMLVGSPFSEWGSLEERIERSGLSDIATLEDVLHDKDMTILGAVRRAPHAVSARQIARQTGIELVLVRMRIDRLIEEGWLRVRESYFTAPDRRREIDQSVM